MLHSFTHLVLSQPKKNSLWFFKYVFSSFQLFSCRSYKTTKLYTSNLQKNSNQQKLGEIIKTTIFHKFVENLRLKIPARFNDLNNKDAVEALEFTVCKEVDAILHQVLQFMSVRSVSDVIFGLRLRQHNNHNSIIA